MLLWKRFTIVLRNLSYMYQRSNFQWKSVGIFFFCSFQVEMKNLQKSCSFATCFNALGYGVCVKPWASNYARLCPNVSLLTGYHWHVNWLQGRVVRKPVNVNPGLNVNWSITFSYLKMFFTSYVWCSLKLLQLKTEGQTIQTEHITEKLKNQNQNYL